MDESTRQTGENGAKKGRAKMRFFVKDYTNRGGSLSYRVTGITLEGKQLRENFTTRTAADCRATELNLEHLGSEPTALPKITTLNSAQLRFAELAMQKLEDPGEIVKAVTLWLKERSKLTGQPAPRLDEAVQKFLVWLDRESGLRDLSKRNLRVRVTKFQNSVKNLTLSDITSDTVDEFLAGQNSGPIAKDNDRRALSRLFSWCGEKPRRWITVNPCKLDSRRKKKDDHMPAILTVEESERFMQAAESYKAGRLALYAAVCLFGGLRPFEASRLKWEHVMLEDRQIRLAGSMTKTGRGRVITISETLAAWLHAYKDGEFFPLGWRRDFDEVKSAIGYGNPARLKGAVADGTKWRPWVPDILRHSAISHTFRQSGSFGLAAEQFGNSEAIIKAHYFGRVSTEDSKRFFAILPTKGNI